MLLRTYLQTQHGIPRRMITRLIDQGQIFLNTQKVESYIAQVHEQDFLSIPILNLQEKMIEKSDSKLPELLIFNKPAGFTCSKADPHNHTFYELLPKEFQQKYYYIGRLDKESRGLLLLTTNPELVHAFEHPSKQVQKEYLVLLDQPFNWGLKEKILHGIREEGELLRVLKIEKADSEKIAITLNEGKKRHIRRIFKVLGYTVTDLQRIRIGDYELGALEEGKRLAAHKERSYPEAKLTEGQITLNS